tara:strand:- start:704 stop:1129 length:426 start_codon:yes stop_codon:yes gene_type:complete
MEQADLDKLFLLPLIIIFTFFWKWFFAKPKDTSLLEWIRYSFTHQARKDFIAWREKNKEEYKRLGFWKSFRKDFAEKCGLTKENLFYRLFKEPRKLFSDIFSKDSFKLLLKLIIFGCIIGVLVSIFPESQKYFEVILDTMG